ncbi:Intraflagellar transport protein 74 [Phlyctochytrium planicorne]|nr:Intraflagellar transport protein 74 [Phlyctochytrium planicorne]
MNYGRPPTGSLANRPSSRLSAGQGPGATVVDRPMTQQGLGGMRTSTMGTGRQVQDTTYFQSELRHKINLLNAEINKLNNEADNITKENSNYATFEKRADTLAQELRELQGQLGDLNTLVDKLHTDSDLADIERHCSQLKAKNERETQILDEIFSHRQQYGFEQTAFTLTNISEKKIKYEKLRG